MSDREYIALALEIEAKAMETRVKGYEAANALQLHAGLPPRCTPIDFSGAEAELNAIAEKVRKLALHTG